MKKNIYIISLLFIFLQSCNSDDEDRKVYTSTTVDISGLKIYAGSEEGPKEVIFDNFRSNSLMNRYFTSVYYKPGLYGNVTIEFAGDKLYYNSGSMRMVSDYVFKDGSLYIIDSDGEMIFVALGDSKDNLYRHKAVYYYLKNPDIPGGEEPTIKRDSTSVNLNLDSIIKYAEYEDIKAMKNPKDTIVWCNIIYPFR